MKASVSLDDLALFLAVADAGALGGAARSTGTSLPTLSRRMTELERRTGERLFLRGRRRYALTAEGRRLAEEMRGLREVRARLDRWLGSGDGAARALGRPSGRCRWAAR